MPAPMNDTELIIPIVPTHQSKNVLFFLLSIIMVSTDVIIPEKSNKTVIVNIPVILLLFNQYQ